MKRIYIGVLSLIIGLSLSSCSDILDVSPHNSMSDQSVWSNLDLANAFLNNCYTTIEAENEFGAMFCNYTDETYHLFDYGTSGYTKGLMTPDNYNTGWTEGKGNTWYHYYSGIKNVNQLLANIDNVPVTSDADKLKKQQIMGQAYFLRAFYYHYLYSLYGRVPLIYRVFSLDDKFEDKRADMDVVADSIVNDCDRAAALLPTEYSSSDDFGRATKGAALAIKARTLLYKASPLFGTPSKEKWQAAANANKAVIDLGVYSLKQVSNSSEYAALFFDTKNPEVIFEKMYNVKGTYGSSSSYVMQAPPGPGSGFEGWSVWEPTYDIVNAFQNADGTDYTVQGLKSYTIQKPTMTDNGIQYEPTTIEATNVNPWENRDIRLKADILCDGEKWGYGDDNREVEDFQPAEEGVTPGKDSRMGDTYWNGSLTGYNMKKFLDPSVNTHDESVSNTTPWFFLRLSEIYLNYAECEIQLGNNDEALKYINLVRTRALLPAATGKDIWSEYKYERKIEPLFEGQRFFDLRRWKEMPEIYSQKNWPTGIVTYKFKDGTKIYTHNTEPLQERTFKESTSYWFPVPRYELNKCPNLDAAPYE